MLSCRHCMADILWHGFRTQAPGPRCYLGLLMWCHESLHTAPSRESGEYKLNVSRTGTLSTPHPSADAYPLRLLGGLLMFAVGVLYVLFEKNILVQSRSAKTALASSSFDGLSSIILGVQVSPIKLFDSSMHH